MAFDDESPSMPAAPGRTAVVRLGLSDPSCGAFIKTGISARMHIEVLALHSDRWEIFTGIKDARDKSRRLLLDDVVTRPATRGFTRHS